MAYNTFNPIVYKGLVLYLDAENLKSYSGSGLNWYDLTSNGNNGVLTNGATFTGNSIQFDGINDGVDFNNLNFPNSGARTITTWLKSTDVNTCSIFAYGDINTPNGSNILHLNIVGGGSIYWSFNNADFYTSPILDGISYYFIACTYNGGVLDASNVKIYLNGIQLSTTSTGGNIGGYPNTLNTSYTVGYDTGIRYFKGDISIIKFYDRELTSSEVLQNYNATKWRFINELPSIITDQLILNLDAGDPASYPGSGTTWYDLTSNNNDGTLVNGVVYSSGSMIFDGVNDFVNLGTSIGKLPQFTISVWLKPSNWNNCGIVFSSNTGGGQAATHWGLWGRVGGNIEVWVSDGLSYQSANTSLSWSSSDVPNSSFTNIVITVDGSNIRIFKNSIQIGSDITQTISQSGTAYDLFIGENPADSGYFYEGSISDVLMYSKALSSTEVIQNFNAQKSRYGL